MCPMFILIFHFVISYQFLEDAYKNHKLYLETMTQQLQDKRKAIEEVSGCVNTGWDVHPNTDQDSCRVLKV